ncbi:probable monogalactosyldiacylglycerol synthase 3, chloroplastic [Papaver somniferum]|uniref:probable monogalactosyldiacylglycerol synthase 3, chloroplastic n=1 Tax=Papaver somniferum TaxID=3469 RepID=UPI000E700488|nr:probable monogalactosyldiacylglycerol synthase 3, chloroplastic [Papaver somniferum]
MGIAVWVELELYVKMGLCEFKMKEIVLVMLQYMAVVLVVFIVEFCLRVSPLVSRSILETLTYLTCICCFHIIRFNIGVNRCYCPSDEVAKSALVDGLESSQIRVFGLPVRPSFCRPVKKTARALGEALFNAELDAFTGVDNSFLCSPQVRGFETQMEKFMGACDCIITKAGRGKIAEALIRGLPIMKQWIGSCIAGSGVVLVQSVCPRASRVLLKQKCY